MTWSISGTSQGSSRSASAAHIASRAATRRSLSGLAEADQLGATVLGVGRALDQAELVEGGQLAADHRPVDAEHLGDLSRTAAAPGGEHAEGDDVGATQVRVEVTPVRAARLQRAAEQHERVEEPLRGSCLSHS